MTTLKISIDFVPQPGQQHTKNVTNDTWHWFERKCMLRLSLMTASKPKQCPRTPKATSNL